MPKRSSKDINETVFSVVKQATGQIPETQPPQKNAAAVALGRLGGLKGGKARASRLSPEDKKRIAQLGAKARWQGNRKA